MNQLLNYLSRIIVSIIFVGLIAATLSFTMAQYQRSQSIDESIVSDLTTRLNTRTVDKALEIINPAYQQ